MNIIPPSIETMHKALDVRAEVQRVTAANIANIDTPGFTARKVDFEASMTNALAAQENPMVINDSTALTKTLDGNNVDLEGELGAMSRNKTIYNLVSQLMANKFRSMDGIFGGSR